MSKDNGQLRAFKRILLFTACLQIPLPVYAQTFSWTRINDLPSLDPHVPALHERLGFLHNVYEPLVQRGADMDIEPALATAWQMLPEGGWRFTLRQDVHFHNGSPFNADDVLFSFNRASAEDNGRPVWISEIDHVRVVDDYTVDFLVSGSGAELPVAALRLMIMDRDWTEKNAVHSAHAVDAFADVNTNGTGPYGVVKRDPGVSTRLQPFSRWWGQNSSNIESALFVPIGHSVTAMAALLAGEVDVVTMLSSDEAVLFRNRQGFTLHEAPNLNSLRVDGEKSRRELPDEELSESAELIWVSSDSVNLTRRRDDILLLRWVTAD